MSMHAIFITLGGLLLLGLLSDEIGRRTRLPRVTILILFGVLIGQSGFDLLPPSIVDWYDFLATTALTMVAFLLGGKLSARALRAHGGEIIIISLVVVLVTTILVGVGLAFAGVPLLLAFVLACIATATDPAAIQDVVRQTRSKGPFTDVLLGIVAVDDAWGLILFSLFLVVANAILGNGTTSVLWGSLVEIGGALLVGVAVGLPAAFLTGRIRSGEPMQAEALGLVFLCAGLATWFEVSFLLSGMISGVIVANLAKHHSRPFHEIEHIEWPFMVLFFILAGASLNLASFTEIGLFGVAYIILRTLSRIVGGWFGCRLAMASSVQTRWMGAALIPQAGVAIGMALVASSHFPEIKEPLLALTIGTTVFFELLGPLVAQIALTKVGEAK